MMQYLYIKHVPFTRLFQSIVIISLVGFFTPSIAQCDYNVGGTATFLNSGYDNANTNICYLVDANDNVIATDASGNCDFPNMAYGAYSVYVLNDCPGGASDIVAVPPTTLTSILAYGAASDVDIAGPANFTVCNPSELTAAENDAVTVNMQPDFNEDSEYSMFYVLVCSNHPEGNATPTVIEVSSNGNSASFTVPDNGSFSSQPSCTVYAINYKNTGLSATAISNITTSSSWATVDPTGTNCVDIESANITIIEGSLPVELMYFQAAKKGDKALLSWKTASEENNKGFHIQHSIDGRNFETIGWKDGFGFTAEEQEYQYVHEKMNVGTNYYRLSQEDFDETRSYSEIRTLIHDSEFSISMFPNPSQLGKNTTLRLFSEQSQNIQIDIFSQTGQQIKSMNRNLESGNNNLILEHKDLSVGIYMVSIQHEEGKENAKLCILK